MAQEAFAEQVIATIAGAARMAAVGGGDVVRLTSTPDDWLDARDPEYIRQVRPRPPGMEKFCFRAEVRGLENIPRLEPVLLVGNHSGGTLIADTFVFAQHFYDHFGAAAALPPARPRPRLPGPRRAREPEAVRHGPGHPETCARALTARRAARVSRRRPRDLPADVAAAEIDFAGRTGFARLALELGAPIVPVVAIGGQETALFLGQGQRISRALSWTGCAAEGVPGPGRAAVRRHAARPAAAEYRCPPRSRSRCCRGSTCAPSWARRRPRGRVRARHRRACRTR